MTDDGQMTDRWQMAVRTQWSRHVRPDVPERRAAAAGYVSMSNTTHDTKLEAKLHSF